MKLQYVLLFTGLRSSNAREMRTDWIELPRAKGGGADFSCPSRGRSCHSMKKQDVTAGYINAHFADMERMREGAEAIATYLRRELGWATERRSSAS